MNVSTGSGQLSASALVRSRPCNLSALEVQTDGTNPATAVIYDGTDATGIMVARLVVAGSSNQGTRTWDFPRRIENGLYVALSGTGAKCIVEWIDG